MASLDPTEWPASGPYFRPVDHRSGYGATGCSSQLPREQRPSRLPLAISWSGSSCPSPSASHWASPAILGVAVRFRRMLPIQQVEQDRLYEREMLSREPHDTVHVSAMAIQAQAGLVLADSRDLVGAARALTTIEDEASRALTEMRSIVGTLRGADREQSAATPRGVAAIDQLAATHAPVGIRVTVERRGETGKLPPAVEAALYRVAQESITNARRHACNATQVHVQVTRDPETVRSGSPMTGNASP